MPMKFEYVKPELNSVFDRLSVAAQLHTARSSFDYLINSSGNNSSVCTSAPGISISSADSSPSSNSSVPLEVSETVIGVPSSSCSEVVLANDDSALSCNDDHAEKSQDRDVPETKEDIVETGDHCT